MAAKRRPGSWSREAPPAYTGIVDLRTRAGALVLSTAALLAASCGSDSPDEPVALDVRVVYVSRLPAGCPDAVNVCYPMCAHHNAPAGLQAIVPLWGGRYAPPDRDLDGALRGRADGRAHEHAAAPLRARHRDVLRRRLQLPAGAGGHPPERDEADEGRPRRAAGGSDGGPRVHGDGQRGDPELSARAPTPGRPSQVLRSCEGRARRLFRVRGFYSFVQVGTRPGVQGAPAFSIAPSRDRRSVSTSVRRLASCFSNASDAVA